MLYGSRLALLYCCLLVLLCCWVLLMLCWRLLVLLCCWVLLMLCWRLLVLLYRRLLALLCCLLLMLLSCQLLVLLLCYWRVSSRLLCFWMLAQLGRLRLALEDGHAIQLSCSAVPCSVPLSLVCARELPCSAQGSFPSGKQT